MHKRKRSTGEGGYGELHAKNPYRNRPPDFAALVAEFPESLGPHIKVEGGRGRIDWKDARAVRALTETLLWRDFKLKVQIPAEHLCPPLPNRINYLCFLSDLLACERMGTDCASGVL
ncbi:hypothetical protein B484DRAFT_405821 [Ochromonadaceae sp. CCMP2298]|nr:hypothetical protein B484DRAFT_405821 [Ochromonadaceae sp. CCMP2298]